jgi:predicted 2-oxoglutarate/Fe(II)-dependent dioxygenase YbiX
MLPSAGSEARYRHVSKTPDAIIRQMAKPEFLEKLGVFIMRDFFDPDQCAQLCAEMSVASHEKGTIAVPRGTPGEPEVVDESRRKVLHTDLGERTEAFVRLRLDELKPEMEKRFKAALTGYSGPHFLRYQPGGHYTVHRDRSPGARSNVAARVVSIVIFLNSASEEPHPGCYGGGALRFHGLMNGPGWENCAFSLDAEPGLLVGFDSTVLHEVLPVTFGERMTVVAWYTAGDGSPPTSRD